MCENISLLRIHPYTYFYLNWIIIIYVTRLYFYQMQVSSDVRPLSDNNHFCEEPRAADTYLLILI